MKKISIKLTDFIFKQYKTILLAYLILIAFSVYFAQKLKFESNFETLLPRTFKSVQTLDDVTNEFGGTGYLVAVLKCEDIEKAKKFAQDFVKELEKIPEVKYVTWRQPKKYFEDRKLLYLDLQDLKEIKRRIKKKIDFEKQKANPLFIDVLDEEYKLDFSDIEKKYEGKDVFKEYYISKDNKELVLLIKPNGLAGNLAFSRRLEKKANEIIKTLNPEKYDKTLEISFTGRYKKQIDLNDQMVGDIKFTIFGSLVLGSLLLFFYFKQIRGIFLVGIPLLSSIIITLALAYLLVGYLNIISGFLFSILMGIGMDYGIIFYSRYVEERNKNLDSYNAMIVAFNAVGKSLVIAAFTTGIAFLSLALAEFKGFSQFGLIAGIGVIVNFIVFNTLHPSMILFFEKIKEPRYLLAFDLKLNVKRYPVYVPVLIFVVISYIYTFANLKKISFEYNFNKIQGSNIPSFILDERVNTIIGTSLTPDIVMVDNLKEAKEVEKALDEKLKNPDTTIDKYASILTFIPENQKEKIKELREIKKILEDESLKVLKGEQKKKIEDVKKMLEVNEITLKNLPPEILRLFFGKSSRSAVYIFPKVDLSDVLLVRKASDEIRDLKTKNKIYHPVSESVIFSDILNMIEKDGKTIMLISFFGTLLPIIFFYRKLKAILLISFHLITILILLLFTMIVFKIKFNFFNVLFLPLVFGLGIDYGEYIYSRYEQEGRGSIYFVLVRTGMAVFMSAFTTMLGFGTLLFADHTGLKTIGQLSVIGIFCAFFSGVFLLLSIFALIERIEKKESKNEKA